MENKKSTKITYISPINLREGADYKFPSCDFPRTMEFNSEEINVNKKPFFNTYSEKKIKKVSFVEDVTIINIQSYKKKTVKKKKNKNNSINEEDFNEDTNNKNCVNCSIM